MNVNQVKFKFHYILNFDFFLHEDGCHFRQYSTFEFAEDGKYHKQRTLCVCFLIWRALSAFQWNIDWCCKGFLLAKI